MKKITVMFAAVAMIFMTAACGGNKNADKVADETEQVADSVLSVDDVVANADSLVGKDIKMEGLCVHVCQHGGGKIKFMASDSTLLKAVAGDFGAFEKECENSEVMIEGTVQENKIDEAAVAKMEQEMKEKLANGEAGCSTEKKATAASIDERIASMRKQIKEREAKEGKAYISEFFIQTKKYEIK